MIIITLGAPGAGKATIAKRLQNFFNFKIVATGEILRHEVSENTEIGTRVKDIMAEGHLVEDQIVIQLVEEQLKNNKDIILEGFPRNIHQAEKLSELLEESGKRIDLVLSFKADDEVVQDRLSGRRICPDCSAIYHTTYFPPNKENTCNSCGKPLVQRNDDKSDIIKTRLDEYHAITEPLTDYYADLGILSTIDANGTVLDMYYQVMESSVKFTTRTF